MHDITPSPSNSQKILTATTTDLNLIATGLADAFSKNPVTAWLLSDIGNTDHIRKAFYRTYTKIYLRDGVVNHTGHFEGISLWSPPSPPSPSLFELTQDYLSWAKVLKLSALKAARFSSLLSQHKPSFPHWYLAILATPFKHRGAGYGGRLLKQQLELCDQEQIPAYLECSTPENIRFYEKFGFTVQQEISLDDSPPLWTMLRESTL